MIETPTLLIGLGGTGGKIAYEVWKPLSDKEKESVGLHIFDTDNNPDSGLGKPEFKPLWDSKMITQTSPSMLVGECYNTHLASTHVASWFPNGDVVGQKPMTDGAGQVRSVSRLAFLDAMARGDMRNLDAAIEKLLTVRQNQGVDAFRVLVVDTLAGGTGSGIFLQVAMYVRYYLTAMRGRTNVVIRNVSLLPALFVNTGAFGDRPQQRQNVLANGYAAVKELDGLIVARNSDISDAEKRFVFPMEMEYLPNSTNSVSVGTGPSPYETIFLIDHVNGNGQSLQSADHYVKQAIDVIKLQLLSPMQGKINGQADNNVRAIDNTQGRGRYASMGSATLSYPYQAIIRYLSLRWASHGLDEQWLKADKLYRAEVEAAVRKQKHDPSVVIPVLRQRFIEIVDHLGTGDTADVFFKQIRRSVQIITRDAKGIEHTREKVSSWLNGVNGYINTAIERVGAVSLARAIDSGALRRESTFVDEVRSSLAEIEILYQKASAIVESTTSMVVNEVLWQDADSEPYVLMNDAARLSAAHRLNTWMLAPGIEEGTVEGLHPVAARYFLCRSLAEINRRYQACETEAKTLRENLVSMRDKYDDPKTPVKETAEDRALTLQNELNWWNKKGKLDEFARRYELDVKQTANLIASWSSKSIEHEVLRRIKSVVEGMISDWETFFSDLDNSLRQSLDGEIAREERAHETGDPMQISVLASAENKRRFWKHVSVDFAHEGISTEVCARLYQAQYLKAVARREDPTGMHRLSGAQSVQTQRMFDSFVVGWCSEKLKARSELKLDIVSAIRKEWEIGSGTGTDADEWLRRRVEQVRSIAAPWLPPIVRGDASHMVFWGVPEVAAAELGGKSGSIFEELFTMNGDNPVINDEFSPFEIKRFSSVFAISIADIPGFRTGTGQYWKAYQDMRSKTLATPGRGMTPHLDKRWDSPACLREIDDQEQDDALQRLHRATLYAILYEEISHLNKDGVMRWNYYEGDRPCDLLSFNGMPCAPDIVGLFLGLASNYRLVPQLCTQAQMNEHEISLKIGQNISKLPIFAKGYRLLDILLTAACSGGRPREDDLMILTSLVNALSDELLACGLRFHGVTNPNTAIDVAENALQSIVDSSKAVKAGNMSEHAKNLSILFQGRAKVWRNKLQQADLIRRTKGVNAVTTPIVFLG